MIRRPPRSTRVRSSAASDVYKRQVRVPPPLPRGKKMNREMRRLQDREDRRLKQKKKQQPRKRRPPRGTEDVALLQRIQRFIREVRAELKRVSWPSREQLI